MPCVAIPKRSDFLSDPFRCITCGEAVRKRTAG